MQKLAIIWYFIIYILRVFKWSLLCCVLPSTYQMVTVQNIFSPIKTKFKARHLLQQCFSKCGLCTSSFGIYWELVGNADSWAPPQAYWVEEGDNTEGGAQGSVFLQVLLRFWWVFKDKNHAPVQPQGTSQTLWTNRSRARKDTWLREGAEDKIIRNGGRGLMNWTAPCLMVAATDYFSHWLPFRNVKQVQI